MAEKNWGDLDEWVVGYGQETQQVSLTHVAMAPADTRLDNKLYCGATRCHANFLKILIIIFMYLYSLQIKFLAFWFHYYGMVKNRRRSGPKIMSHAFFLSATVGS